MTSKVMYADVCYAAKNTQTQKKQRMPENKEVLCKFHHKKVFINQTDKLINPKKFWPISYLQ